jgi:hypothetical protein
VLARRGELERAETLAQEAAELSDRTEWPNLRGMAQTSLAEVLLSAGQAEKAGLAAERALEIYEAKGNVAGAAQARALQARLSAGAAPGA